MMQACVHNRVRGSAQAILNPGEVTVIVYFRVFGGMTCPMAQVRSHFTTIGPKWATLSMSAL